MEGATPVEKSGPKVTRTLNEKRGEPRHRRGSDNLVKTKLEKLFENSG